jgi:hypothetical protein
VRARSLAVTGLVLVTAACGLSDGEQQAADSVRQALIGHQASDHAIDQADCVSKKWVGEVGTGALTRDGVLNGKLRSDPKRMSEFLTGRLKVSAADAQAYARAYVACQDYDVIAKDAATQHPGASNDQVDDFADCLKDIPVDTRRQAVADGVTGKSQSNARQAVQADTLKCTHLLA